MTAGPRNAKAISVLFQPAIMAVISMQKKTTGTNIYYSVYNNMKVSTL